MVQKPIAKEVAHRFAALVGRGLTQHEAARAVGIGTRTGERLMTKPEIRQIVEQTRAARPELVGEPYETISALLKATDADGNPDWAKRLEGAELALSQLAGESADKETLPEGVYVVYPTRA
jgi:hypothetical protein